MDENQDLIKEINLYQMEKHKNIMKLLKYQQDQKQNKMIDIERNEQRRQKLEKCEIYE